MPSKKKQSVKKDCPVEKKPRATITALVTELIKKAHDAGALDKLIAETVRGEVLKKFPKSKFNPTHFSWYRGRFLKSIHSDQE